MRKGYQLLMCHGSSKIPGPTLIEVNTVLHDSILLQVVSLILATCTMYNLRYQKETGEEKSASICMTSF